MAEQNDDCILNLGAGGQTGSFPTLKVSNHYEPNDRYHRNIRKRPICPPIFLRKGTEVAGLSEPVACHTVL
jgi:hypothetical protein